MNKETICEIQPWSIVEKEFNKDNVLLSESLFSQANGYMGIRGNFEEAYSDNHHQGTYIGGVWYPDRTVVGWWKNGYPEYFGKVINNIDFISLDITIDNCQLDLAKNNLVSYHRELNFKQAILTRSFEVKINNKNIKVECERFLSKQHKELAVIKYSITADEDCEINIDSILNGNVINKDANYKEVFWNHITTYAKNDNMTLIMQTKENQFDVESFRICAVAQTKFNIDLKLVNSIVKDKYVANRYNYKLQKNQQLIIYKYVVITTSRDYALEELENSAITLLQNIAKHSYDELYEMHVNSWASMWDLYDVKISGDEESQQAIRYCIYQLLSTYDGQDNRLNIGPKGFTGEKYGGGTYWDTEAYCLTFYLAYDATIARNLLLYRYHQLPSAIENAKLLGLDGALYPMVTFNGKECHNEWEITFEEIHRNGAMVWAIYMYYMYTSDEEYLKKYGIDIVINIAKFWASRVHYQSEKNLYMIHGVTGPNEYENNVNNNWYTNYFARWCLQYALNLIKKYDTDLKKYNLDEKDLVKWSDIVSKMYLPYDPKNKIFVQHDTFLDKEFIKASELTEIDRPLNKNWSWDRILRSCFIKQADVLQGLYFFNDQFTLAEIKANFDFYEPLTVHESSLSPCIHAILASQLGYREKAYELFLRQARLDLDNYNKDTQDGLHITSMSGAWLAVTNGFAQMKIIDNNISFAPIIPEKWESYEFKVNFRDCLINIKVTRHNVIISSLSDKSVELMVYGKKYELSENELLEVNLDVK